MHMPHITILCAAMLSFAALADERVAHVGRDEVRTFEAPCDDAQVLRFIPEDEREAYSRATGRVQGQRFVACWREEGSVVHLYWEDGDQSVVPVQYLKRVMNI